MIYFNQNPKGLVDFPFTLVYFFIGLLFFIICRTECLCFDIVVAVAEARIHHSSSQWFCLGIYGHNANGHIKISKNRCQNKLIWNIEMVCYCQCGLILIELCFYIYFFRIFFYSHMDYGREIVKRNHCVQLTPGHRAEDRDV